jgi:hypothetical protein
MSGLATFQSQTDKKDKKDTNQNNEIKTQEYG